MLVLVFILLGAVNSFLLDTPQGQTTSNQYLSLSKFYEEIKLQEQKSTLLRHDMDNSLNLLTTQLQQKFDLLDKKLAEIERQNETIPVAVNLEQRFTQLEQKYLNLEQNYNTLTKENNVLQIKKNEMENELFSLRNETINQHKELELLKNKSLLTDQNVEALGHLKSIQPLQEIKTLQQQVGSISAQTSSLNMKDQARNQDFLALYDKVQKQGTINTRSMTNLSTQLKTLQMDLGTQIKSLQTIYNTSITDLDMSLKILQKNQSSIFVGIESKIDDASLRDHQTLIQLQRQIATCNDQGMYVMHIVK
ncbi:uncharacterized protein [Mytilus edulis]|uniref:uncharacterized protein n=1 Tax=Mytilus edulis TaxID=6550 RepID=UPI0039EEBB66